MEALFFWLYIDVFDHQVSVYSFIWLNCILNCIYSIILFFFLLFFLFVYCSLNFFPVKIGLINILTFSTHALNYIFNLLGMINGKNPNLSATNFGNRPQDVVTKRNPGESENSGRALPLKWLIKSLKNDSDNIDST